MAKKNNSDAMGRALEYAIVDGILSSNLNVKYDKRTIEDQKRDKPKYDTLSANIKSNYNTSANQILVWLKKTFGIKDTDEIVLRRLSDDEAKKGNVTDIELLFKNEKINLSIKHNHTALKHQRPGALAQQCGLLGKSTEDIQYRIKYKEICENFITNSNLIVQNLKTFEQLKTKDVNYIDNNLYQPMCSLVSTHLNLWGKDSCNAKYFFSFIVGMTNFYKVIVRDKGVEILKFNNIPIPRKMTSTVEGKSYVKVKFDNDWEISMRLHTASSRTAGVSLKFDTQPFKKNIPKKILKF